MVEWIITSVKMIEKRFEHFRFHQQEKVAEALLGLLHQKGRCRRREKTVSLCDWKKKNPLFANIESLGTFIDVAPPWSLLHKSKQLQQTVRFR